MTLTADVIQAALAALDANDAEVWTAEGLPRLDAVRNLTGDPTITREDLNKASPGFIRPAHTAVAPAPWSNAASSLPSAEFAAPISSEGPITSLNLDDIDDDIDELERPSEELAAAITPAVNTDAPMVEDGFGENSMPLDDLSDDPDVAEVQYRLQAATLELEQMTAAKVRLLQMMQVAQEEVDRLTEEVEALVGKETNTDALQGYLNSQKQILAQRAKRIIAMQNSGFDLRALMTGLKAPVDMAMSRKSGRGGKRPSRL